MVAGLEFKAIYLMPQLVFFSSMPVGILEFLMMVAEWQGGGKVYDFGSR